MRMEAALTSVSLLCALHSITCTKPGYKGGCVIYEYDGSRTCTLVSSENACEGRFLGFDSSCECENSADVVPSGVVDIDDLTAVNSCMGALPDDPAPSPDVMCRTADINCDGVIDPCDIAIVICAQEGGADCTASTECGACVRITEDSQAVCVTATREDCGLLEGAFSGATSRCPDARRRCERARPGCDCNADLDNSGTVEIGDGACIRDCLGYAEEACETCPHSDIDCSGRVDACDLSLWHYGYAHETVTCDADLGACFVGSDCTPTTAEECGGSFMGVGTTCPSVDL